jgi:hypothetical protein
MADFKGRITIWITFNESLYGMYPAIKYGSIISNSIQEHSVNIFVSPDDDLGKIETFNATPVHNKQILIH